MAFTKEAIKNDRIILAHGGGGEMTRRLIEGLIVPRLANDVLSPLDDSAVLDVPGGGRICFTTDSYVVQPIEFPGGDIGRLAVCGTVNDLAVMGAEPRALSLAMIVEEGLDREVLERMLDSIAAAAAEAGVVIATGDTKVVDRSRGDGLMLTTAGVGVLDGDVALDVKRIQPGDAIIVTSRIAEHGLTVMAAREGLGLKSDMQSDAAPLNSLTRKLLEDGGDVRFLRDATRGGVAGVLADLSEATGMSIEVEEANLPISPAATHLAELLGLDPLAVANEGVCVAVVAGDDAKRALAACRSDRYGRNAAVVGKFTAAAPPLVELVTRSGGRRIVQRPYGEELPRIC